MKDELCPDVFRGERLRDRVRIAVIDGVRRIADKFPVKVKQVFILGSIVTYQYREDSDIDVNVVIGGVDESYVKDKINDFISEINESVYINTHPINYKIVLGEFDMRKAQASYDVIQNAWLKRASRDNNDVSQTLKSPSVQLQFEDLKGRIEQLHEDLIEVCRSGTTFNQVNQDLAAIDQEYHAIKDARRNYYDAHPEQANASAINVLYKLIEEMGYLKLCQKVLHALGDGNKVRTQQELQAVQEAFNSVMGQNPVPECGEK